MTTRTQKKHEVIVKTAKTLFLKQGFTATSMEQIAAIAGVSKKTVYHHFPSKIDLFHAVTLEHWQTTMQVKQPLFMENKSIAENLDLFAHQMLDFLCMKKTRDLFRLLIAESVQFPELPKALLTNNAGPYTAELIRYLAQQSEQGNLNIPDPELAAYQFLGMIKERNFWVRLAGVSAPEQRHVEKSIAKSIAMFLAYYQN